MISDLVLVHPVSTSNGGELVDTYPGQPDHPQTGHFQLVTRLPRLDNEAGQHAAVSFFSAASTWLLSHWVAGRFGGAQKPSSVSPRSLSPQ